MKKVAIVGENPDKPSGFGQQTDFLARALSEDYDVTVLSQDGLPKKKKPYKSIANLWTDYPQMDRLFESIKPDIFIMFGPLQAHGGYFLSELNKHVSPYLWLAWESISPDLGMVAPLSQLPPNRIVHLSNFSRELWAPYCTDKQAVIPHAVNTEDFYPLRSDHKQLCEELSEKYVQHFDPKAFKILFLDRNDSRKRHDLAVDVARRLLAMGLNLQIVFHTKKKDASYDVSKLCELMGLPRDRYILTDFDWCKGLSKEDLNKLYNVCQARLSCSGGEGFGIPSIEAMAAGCVNVAPNNTCFPEILDDSGLLINCSNLNGSFYQSAVYHDIDVSHAVELLYTLAAKPALRESLVNKGLSVAKQYSEDAIKDKWLKLLSREENNTPKVLVDYSFGIGQREKELRQVALKAAIITNECENKDNFLDIQSGEGILIEYLNRSGIKATGIEQNPLKVDKASEYAVNFLSFAAQLPTTYEGISAIHFNRPDCLTPLELAGFLAALPVSLEKLYLSVDTSLLSQDKNRKIIMSRAWWLSRIQKTGLFPSEDSALVAGVLPDFLMFSRVPLKRKQPIEVMLNDYRRVIEKSDVKEVPHNHGADVSIVEGSTKTKSFPRRTKGETVSGRV